MGCFNSKTKDEKDKETGEAGEKAAGEAGTGSNAVSQPSVSNASGLEVPVPEDVPDDGSASPADGAAPANDSNAQTPTSVRCDVNEDEDDHGEEGAAGGNAFTKARPAAVSAPPPDAEASLSQKQANGGPLDMSVNSISTKEPGAVTPPSPGSPPASRHGAHRSGTAAPMEASTSTALAGDAEGSLRSSKRGAKGKSEDGKRNKSKDKKEKKEKSSKKDKSKKEGKEKSKKGKKDKDLNRSTRSEKDKDLNRSALSEKDKDKKTSSKTAGSSRRLSQSGGERPPVLRDGSAENKMIVIEMDVESPLGPPRGALVVAEIPPTPHGARAPVGAAVVPYTPSSSYLSTTPSPSSLASSIPQLFRVEPSRRAARVEGSWAWWFDQVRLERLTRDRESRTRLQDLRNRLARQHEQDPLHVELDLHRCYLERTAPYLLCTLICSPLAPQLRWVTSLRLDGNYFTDHGFGSLLAGWSAANEHTTLFPLLQQLDLSRMNLDQYSVTGLLSFLFPIDDEAMDEQGAASPTIGGGRVFLPTADYAPLHGEAPRVPLLPSLAVLSLADNEGLGTAGLLQILRSCVAVHHEGHTLTALDLSRCGIDRDAVPYLKEFLEVLPMAAGGEMYPVIPESLILVGNEMELSSASPLTQLESPVEVRLVV